MTFVFITTFKGTMRHICSGDGHTLCGLITSAWWMLGSRRSLKPPTDHYVDCKLCNRSLRKASRS
jgi:hypothetical protein